MERIWAPWREAYIRGKKEGCFLCDKLREKRDEENFIITRRNFNFAVLNIYPYNPGHIMVAPLRHVKSPEELEPHELLEHFSLVNEMVSLLRKAFSPHAFNIGINLGKVAGAGLEDHFHTHVVPRWEGDTNFMPVIMETKVISSSLESVYKTLKEALSP